MFSPILLSNINIAIWILLFETGKKGCVLDIEINSPTNVSIFLDTKADNYE